MKRGLNSQDSLSGQSEKKRSRVDDISNSPTSFQEEYDESDLAIIQQILSEINDDLTLEQSLENLVSIDESLLNSFDSFNQTTTTTSTSTSQTVDEINQPEAVQSYCPQVLNVEPHALLSKNPDAVRYFLNAFHCKPELVDILLDTIASQIDTLRGLTFSFDPTEELTEELIQKLPNTFLMVGKVEILKKTSISLNNIITDITNFINKMAAVHDTLNTIIQSTTMQDLIQDYRSKLFVLQNYFNPIMDIKHQFLNKEYIVNFLIHNAPKTSLSCSSLFQNKTLSDILGEKVQFEIHKLLNLDKVAFEYVWEKTACFTKWWLIENQIEPAFSNQEQKHVYLFNLFQRALSLKVKTDILKTITNHTDFRSMLKKNKSCENDLCNQILDLTYSQPAPSESHLTFLNDFLYNVSSRDTLEIILNQKINAATTLDIQSLEYDCVIKQIRDLTDMVYISNSKSKLII